MMVTKVLAEGKGSVVRYCLKEADEQKVILDITSWDLESPSSFLNNESIKEL